MLSIVKSVTHTSARELLLKRDQYTGENLIVDDKEVSGKQKDRREKENKQKLDENTKKDVVQYNKGDMVFVISDKNKHKARDTYLVVKVEDNTVEIVKTKQGKTAGKKYS